MSTSRPNSRSGQPHSSTKSEQSRPHSTSPKIPRKSEAVRNGEPRTKAGLTSSSGNTASKKVATETTVAGDRPGSTRRVSSPSGVRPTSRSGDLKAGGVSGTSEKSTLKSSGADTSRQKNTCSPTGEESKKKQSTVLERKSSPLAQRKVAATQGASKRGRSSPEDGKQKSPMQNPSPGAVRRASVGVTKTPRSSASQGDRAGTKPNGKLSPNSARKQVTSGKPPSGAHAASGKSASATNLRGAKSAASQQTNDESPGAGVRASSPAEKQEKVRKTSASRGASGGGAKKTATSALRTSSSGRDSPASSKDRKPCTEKRPRSMGSSPASLRRTASVRRSPGEGSANPGVARRSSTLRRISSSGSIPTNQKPKLNAEKKAGSVSPKVERRVSAEKKTSSASPKNERREKKTSAPGLKVGLVSPGTARRSSAESARKTSTEKRAGENPSKQTTGLNPAGRHSLRSRSEVSVLASSGARRNDTQSSGRKISAVSSIGRGSRSPNTLTGKSIIIDSRELHHEDRVQSTLKLFGVKRAHAKGSGVPKTSKGPVIKSMGMGSGRSTPHSGRGTPTGRGNSPHTTPATEPGLTRTGSGSTAMKASPKVTPDSRERLHSSDDILKPRHSPSPTEPLRAPSPLSKSSNAQPRENQIEKKVDVNIKSPKEKALKSGGVSRPSCRNTQVKSKIATWKKMEEEAKNIESPSISPVPPSPRSPHTSTHVSSPPSKPPPSSFSHSSTHASPTTTSPNHSTSPPPTSSTQSPGPATSSSSKSSRQASLSPSRSTKATVPESEKRRRGERSQSPVVSAPVKSRIALWAAKEKEAHERRSSLSPQRSPQHSPHSSPPQSSPQASPHSSPRGLRRQTPIDRHRVSPAHSSGEGSVETSPSRQQGPSITVEGESVNDKTTASNAAGKEREDEDEVYDDVVRKVVATGGVKSVVPESEMYETVEVSPTRRRLPEIPVSVECVLVREPTLESSAPLIQDEIYSTIPDVYQRKGDQDSEPPKLLPRLGKGDQAPKLLPRLGKGDQAPKLPPRLGNKPHSVQGEGMIIHDIEDDANSQGDKKSSESGYNRLKPVYAEIPILEEQSMAVNSVRSSLPPPAPLTPKTKRKWLRSPRFGRRKSSGDDKEEGATGGDRDEKKHEGFIRRLGKIGSRSSKDRQVVKRRSGEPDVTSKMSYDSDSGASSSPGEDSQSGLTAASSSELRQRLSSELGNADELALEAIPRSNSYSPAGNLEVGYALTSRKKLDPGTQRVVSSDPALAENSTQYDVVKRHRKLDLAMQRVVSDPSLDGSSLSSEHTLSVGSDEQLLAKSASVHHHRKSAPSSSGPRHRTGAGSNILSHDIRSLIDNMGDGLEFCEEYSKKVSILPGHTESPPTVGSAPGGLRLPVRFDLNRGPDKPGLVKVGFDLDSESSLDLPNGTDERERRGTSDSSTASEGEEQLSSEKEEERDQVCPIESSLDKGMQSRYDIKRRLSESSDKSQSCSAAANGQNSENLVATSLMYADAVWDRVANDSDELSFRVGDVIEILDMTDDTWWQGSVQEKSGWFPSAFVRLRIAQDEEDEDIYAVPPDAMQVGGGSGTLPRVTTMPGGDPTYATFGGRSSNSKGNRRMTIRRKDSCPSMPRKLTPSEVRAKIVDEILNTERDYVKHLEDIIEGFLKKCRINTKLFDKERIETIFSNLENLYQFQIDFLQQLESRISDVRMEDSQIGEVFVANRDGFAVYSDYCNNHPHAVNEMCVLQKKEQYAFFFEELLKYTSEDHPDRPHVEAAVEAMRHVAQHINEAKRRLENIGRIGRWQESIDGWKGPDIVETSTEMIHSSELHKISKGHSQERHFFLFDNQLIYCKKDAIGGRLCYKGRLAMETCHVTDLPDGQETHNGVAVKNAWKMDNQAKGKDYIIFAKSAEVKSKWMDAFKREKDRVAQDRESGFRVSLKMKRAAAALSSANARVGVAKRNRSFNKKQALKVQALSVSIDSGVKVKLDASPARERKGKFSRMKQIF